MRSPFYLQARLLTTSHYSGIDHVGSSVQRFMAQLRDSTGLTAFVMVGGPSTPGGPDLIMNT